MTTHAKPFIMLLLIFTMVSACGDDMGQEMEMKEEEQTEDACADVQASFKDDISDIISASCAISGCHVSGFSNGDFSNYDGINDAAGTIRTRAVVQKNMPPNNSSGPDLTAAQIELLDCWIQSGAEDN